MPGQQLVNCSFLVTSCRDFLLIGDIDAQTRAVVVFGVEPSCEPHSWPVQPRAVALHGPQVLMRLEYPVKLALLEVEALREREVRPVERVLNRSPAPSWRLAVRTFQNVVHVRDARPREVHSGCNRFSGLAASEYCVTMPRTS